MRGNKGPRHYAEQKHPRIIYWAKKVKCDTCGEFVFVLTKRHAGKQGYDVKLKEAIVNPRRRYKIGICIPCKETENLLTNKET